jgi:hypothetical protein
MVAPHTPAPVVSPPRAWRRARHLAWRRLGEEAVLLDLHRRVVYGLNEAAATVLEWLAEPRRAPSAGPLLGFLERLRTDGLIEPADEGGGEPPALTGEPRVLWEESLQTLAQQGGCLPASQPQSLCLDPSCQS